jgi:hypothetical protein
MVSTKYALSLRRLDRNIFESKSLKKMNRSIHHTAWLIIVFCATVGQLTAQNSNLRIDEWRTHFPYHQGIYVAQSTKAAYYATPFAIVRFDKSDLTNERIDLSTRLNGANPQLVHFHQPTKKLLICYENAEIDLLDEEGTANAKMINDIRRNSAIVGDKRIYQIISRGDTAYMACGFGVLTFNVRKAEFISTTFIPSRVNSVALYDGKLYAATETGMYRVNNDGVTNLSDFRNWQRIDAAFGFPNTYRSLALGVFNQKLYFDVRDTLKSWDFKSNTTPQKVYQNDSFQLRFMSYEGANLLIGLYGKGDYSSRVLTMRPNGTVTYPNTSCVSRTVNAVEEPNGRIWYGDEYDDYRFSNVPNNGATCNTWNFNGPYSPSATDIAIAADGRVLAPFGGSEVPFYSYNRAGFTLYRNNQWLNISAGNSSILADSMADIDFYKAAFHPNGKAYIGCYWGGLIEMTGDKVTKIWTDKTAGCTLKGTIGDESRERVTGLAFDKKNTLWVANYNSPLPLHALTTDGKWYAMKPTTSMGVSELLQLVVDSSGYKWAILGSPRYSAILVYDEGKKIEDISDDQFKVIDNSNSQLARLKNARPQCLAVDLEGSVWVGTSAGVISFTCGTDPFRSEACKGNVPIVSLNKISEYLLGSQSVRCIAIDGANRKWFGTGSGIFVQSPDGLTNVATFNKENSPLPSNSITAMNINQKTGEVWISTDRGIVQYQTDAIAGGTVNQDTAFAFPNPVRPDYEGEIAIRGLARDANVKITDVNGQIVFETKALGGQAIWYGRDLAGTKVSTGVYFVWATYTKNTELINGVVTKILVVH